MNEQIKQPLMDYGRMLMKQVAGKEPGKASPAWAAAFLDLLNLARPAFDPAEPLQSIFTLIDVRGQAAYLRPVPLSLVIEEDNWILMPTGRTTAASEDRSALYGQFGQAGGLTETGFNRFFHLMRKYASTLPNTYGERGVSLFEQWKMVAALVTISGSTEETPSQLGLVSGDIPGIQRTINLVTSKGAAKAMRGRSAFIQLLGHALVERILAELHLGPANVVYDAGGNFLLLTGWDDKLPNRMEKIANDVNRVLLGGASTGSQRFDGFHGDLAVALAAVELPVEALQVQTGSTGSRSRWQEAEKKVKDAVGAAKSRPFGDLVLPEDDQALPESDDWNLLFAPEPSETDEFCAVCRRQRRSDEEFYPLDEDAPDDVSIRSTKICFECKGFNRLASLLGHHSARLLIDEEEPEAVEGWQAALYGVTRKWYSIGDENRRLGDVTLELSLDSSMNETPDARVTGFKLLARTTPMIGRTIKPNDELAAASTGGMKRLGVLRMDVDDLGNLIVNGLPRRSAMATAELSQSTERFFAAWLDRICARVDEGKGLFYVLFAGGDDLFVIGPWSLMVPLAQAINDQFRAYVNGHPAIHLSAGIAIVGGKAPLYAAADMAHEALDEAKDLKTPKDAPKPEREKDAITFLGRTYHWDHFKKVVEMKELLFKLRDVDNLPASLLTTLLAIEQRYRKDQDTNRGTYGDRLKKDNETIHIYFGPWMWRQAYSIARLKQRYSDKVVVHKLDQLETSLLNGEIENLGLAARWTRWLTRKEA